jgi:hypothetical protein
MEHKRDAIVVGRQCLQYFFRQIRKTAEQRMRPPGGADRHQGAGGGAERPAVSPSQWQAGCDAVQTRVPDERAQSQFGIDSPDRLELVGMSQRDSVGNGPAIVDQRGPSDAGDGAGLGGGIAVVSGTVRKKYQRCLDFFQIAVVTRRDREVESGGDSFFPGHSRGACRGQPFIDGGRERRTAVHGENDFDSRIFEDQRDHVREAADGRWSSGDDQDPPLRLSVSQIPGFRGSGVPGFRGSGVPGPGCYTTGVGAWSR